MYKLASLLAVLGLTLAACSESNESPVVGAAQSVTTTAPAATTPTSLAPATTVAPATTATPATTAVQKANANTASQSEVQAALAAAGVPSAAQWAREVVEYRPYPTNDPTLAKLRQNLVKYNPGPGVVDQIVSALSL